MNTADCYCWREVPGEPGGHSESLLGRFFTETEARNKVYLASIATGLLCDLDGVWQADAIGTYSSFVSDGRVGSYGWSNVATWRLAQIRATGNQVVLAWMLASKQVRTLPLIGPRTFHQYLEYVGALDISLTPEHVEMLDQAGES